MSTMTHLADHRPTDDLGDDVVEYHTHDDGPCFSCWCYSCGGRTDEPRIERDNDRHVGDPSHRWCFE